MKQHAEGNKHKSNFYEIFDLKEQKLEKTKNQIK
jgi:hypothetical protein